MVEFLYECSVCGCVFYVFNCFEGGVQKNQSAHRSTMVELRTEMHAIERSRTTRSLAPAHVSERLSPCTEILTLVST